MGPETLSWANNYGKLISTRQLNAVKEVRRGARKEEGWREHLENDHFIAPHDMVLA